MNGKKNILLTGATGYIGRELVPSLLQNTNNVAIVVRDVDRAKKLFENDVTYIDFNDNNFKSEISKFNPNIVIHLAAYSTSSDTTADIKKLIESNITFTALLLDALSDCNFELFVNTGSFSEYYFDNGILSPTYFYSATKISSKYILEYFSKKDNFKVVNAILYTVYGKRNKNKKIIDYAIDSLNTEEAVNMSDGKQVLDFIHISDIVNFYMNLVCNYNKLNLTQEDYYVGTGKGTSIREMVKILEHQVNKKANINWGANKSRKIDTIQAIADVEKTTEDLQWSTKIDFEQGLKKYLDNELEY